MVQPLEKTLSDEIISCINAGYAQKKTGAYNEAERHYLRAWSLFPEPKYEWDSSQITLYSIADFYLEWKKFDKALDWVNLVFKTAVLPGDASPYVVIGKIYFEAANLDLAFDNFNKAFSLAKKRGFDGEDKKYLDFYIKRASGK